MARIIHIITRAALAAALIATTATIAAGHYKNEKRPHSFADAVIPMTAKEFRREPRFRHSPGNVRAEDMRALFGNAVLVVNSGRQFPGYEYRLKVIFAGRNGRYQVCSYDIDLNYTFTDHPWAPTKYKHDGKLWHRLDPKIDNERPGLGLLYDGTTGQVVHYRYRDKRWKTWNLGHLQERLPRAVWTLCPDFPSAEELGVGVNEAQTAITYDKLIAQDPGRRILRPDLITPDPTEMIE